jgi:dolichyl-phosphate-mannose--protein O-mannosyl transferase
VLAISFLGGLFFLRNPQTYWWQFGIAVAATFCVIMATLTWREAMNMIEFQAKRPITEEDGPPEEDG